MSDEERTVTQKQRAYASVENPTINAAIKSLYSFVEQSQALARLAQIKRDFVTSRQVKTAKNSNSFILWVSGFAISEAEAEQGYKGNFALFSVMPREGKFTISAKKIESELKFHPQSKRVKRKHPDWGHPILRDIKKKRLYFSMDEAVGELIRLHEEYPETSIPSEFGLLIIIYGKELAEDVPVQKYKFSVRPLADGTFVIDYKENKKTAKPRPQPPRNAEGFFSQKEKIRRTMKKNRPKPIEKPKTDNSSC